MSKKPFSGKLLYDGGSVATFEGITRRKYFRLLRVVFLVSLVVAGLWARSLSPVIVRPRASMRWPWRSARTVTLYFIDRRFLVPVSRQMPAGGDLPHAALEALVAGPSSRTDLITPIPHGVHIRSVKVENRIASVDLSREFRDAPDIEAAQTAIVETLTELPDITWVGVNVEGVPLNEARKRVPLIYYGSPNGIVAIPAAAADARAALAVYLSGPANQELTGLPPDVRVLSYHYGAADGLLSINFTYTPSLHELALEKPERIRFALLGLIASLTEFSDIRAVELDFEGHTRLGLGQCSDLLRTPQPRPELLNDERLLGR